MQSVTAKTYRSYPIVAWGHREPGMAQGCPVVRDRRGKYWVRCDISGGGSRVTLREALHYPADTVAAPHPQASTPPAEHPAVA